MSPNTNPRVILITGASSGFGRLLTEIALANGDIVVATLRKPEVLKDLQDRTPKERLLLLKVDVTREDDIRDAFTKAKDKFGRVDVVYNNAAIWFTSTVEAVPDDKARALFETNFWGATRVSREAVRFFRDENPKGAGGRLIVISSAAGLIANGGIGFYSASKYALEAITEALAKEIDPQWNIKISLVEPGSFRTEGIGAVVHHPAPEAYSTPTSGYSKAIAMVSLLGKPEFKIGDARKGAQKLYELSTVESPPLRRLLGQDAVALTRGHLKGILEEVDASESWSSGLLEE